MRCRATKRNCAAIFTALSITRLEGSCWCLRRTWWASFKSRYRQSSATLMALPLYLPRRRFPINASDNKSTEQRYLNSAALAASYYPIAVRLGLSTRGYNWNKKLLPDLRNLLEEVRSTRTCRLVRARGLARLSAWFALGFTFSEVAGYVIEVEQQSEHWRTDVSPSIDFRVVVSSKDGAPVGEAIAGTGTAVACGISVTGILDVDVRRHVAELTAPAALLLLRPERAPGRECVRGGADVVALARSVKELLRPFVKHWGATRVLLYYFGPLSGACFIGHQLNAVCREIQIMEDQQPGYAPSFLLSS
jgi:hypothetical protein